MLKSIALAGFLFAGCVGSGTYSGTAGVEAAPALVEVSPGVQVVADYDYPVFYSDGAYYRYDGGTWYRSSHYRDGWSRTYDVPARVRGIDRPGAYAHYHANANANVTTYNRERDHREFDQRNTPAPQPIIRDHRDETPAPVIQHDDRRDERERDRIPNATPVPPAAPTPQPNAMPQGPREDHPRQEREQPARDDRREQPKRDDRKDERDRKDKDHRD